MDDYKTALLNKIATRQARVAVIGLGYVGLPLAVEFAALGECDSKTCADAGNRLLEERPTA